MANSPLVVMVGTDPGGAGGVASVIRGYVEAGLTERWPIVFLKSHCEGSVFSKILAWLGSWLHLVWLIGRRQCGVLHLHSSSRMSFWRKWSFHLIARAGRVPIIWHVHGGDFARFYEVECGPWRRRMVRRTLGSAFRVVALSVRWERVLQKIAPRAHVTVIPNAVAHPVILEIPQRRQATLLFLGQITERKGIFDLLRALHLLVPSLPSVRLCVAGNGEKEKVLAFAKSLGIEDRVQLLGWIAGKDKNLALAQASVVVLPSYAEGMPMVLLEAMGYATPVIGTNVGGVPDLVRDGETGLLVQPGDIQGLKGALLRILTDLQLATQMGMAGQRMVLREYAIDSVMARLGSLYRLAGVSAVSIDVSHASQRRYTKL